MAGSKTINATFADEAAQFIEGHRRERWFLWFATTAPHTPYYHDPHHYYTRWQVRRAPPPPLWPREQPLCSYDWAAYYSTTSLLDDQIGRLLQELDRLGLAQDTLVIFLSDNGMMHGSHGLQGKGVWYEEAVRVPALVRWPGRVAARSRITSPASGVDLGPTCVDAAGGGAQDDLPGTSLLPALTGRLPADRADKDLFSEVRKKHSTGEGADWQLARHGRWKYVRLRDGGERLYDLDRDPGEWRDVATSGDADSTAAIQDMRRRLDTWLTRTP
jgi:arylsulfatase A-like enzyme